jgi:DNA-binding transcriptional LysR family regulator
MGMDLRQLRYFLAVAEHEHMTRASESLFVSQPALSQQIASLERELETPLFDRIGRGMELTTAGRVLREQAVRILREVDNARAAIDDLNGTVRGEVVVATIQTANVSLLVGVIARFRTEHPGVVVRVREERGSEVLELVRSGEANLGLTYLPEGAPERLEMTPLYPEELVLVVPEGHPLAGATLRTSEVANLPLVVPPGGYCLRSGIDAVLAEAGSRQTVVAEITSIEGICEAVRSGVGLSILPARYIVPRAERHGLAVVQLIDPIPHRMVGVVRSSERHACTATRAFLASLRGDAEPGAQAGLG